MKLKLRPALAALGLVMAAGSASAAITWYAGGTTFEDTSLEHFYLDADGDGRLGLGDQLYTVVEITSTASINPTGSTALVSPGELTGISVIQVTGVFNTSGDPDGCAVGGCAYEFGPVTSGGGMNQILLDVTGTNFGLAPGAMVALWSSTIENLDLIAPNCTTVLGCTNLATDGVLWEVDGFGPSAITGSLFADADNYWNAIGVPDNRIATVAAGAPGSTFASINFGGDVLYNGTGQVLTQQSCGVFCTPGGDGFVDVIGSGNLKGGEGLSTDFFARDDFDFDKRSVPEPTTLALLGMALLGMGTLRRKAR